MPNTDTTASSPCVRLLSWLCPCLAVAPAPTRPTPPPQQQYRPNPASQPLRQQVPPPQIQRQESAKRVGEGPREIAKNSSLGIGQTQAEKQRGANKKKEEQEIRAMQIQQMRQERSGDTSALWFLNMGI